MAGVSNPKFGAGFNETAFREAIRSTMTMGMPNTVEERATFIWVTKSTHAKTNAAGRPFDFNQPALSVEVPEEVQVPCAYEFIDRVGHGTPVGQFENPRVKLYLMDEDYELVKGASKVRLGGNMYQINFVEPPVSLFLPTLYTLWLQSEDEA